jgi:hypothetical protein
MEEERLIAQDERFQAMRAKLAAEPVAEVLEMPR